MIRKEHGPIAGERAAAPGRGWGLGAEVGLFLGFVLLAVYVTWPLAADPATKVAHDLGDPMANAWIFGWGAHGVVAQPRALFHANFFFPSRFSLAFAENMLGLSVPLAPVFWLSGNAVLVMNLATILALGASGWAVYALVREATASRPAAVVAGIIYVAAPYRVGAITHVHVVATHLLPLVLLMALRLTRRPTWARAGLLGLVLAAQLWSSLTAGILTLVALAVWAVWVIAVHRGRALRPLVHAGAGVMVAMALTLPVLLPYAHARELNPGFQHPSSELIENSATPGSYLDPPRGGAVAGAGYRRLAERFGASGAPEKQLFAGAVASAAMVAAVALLILRGRGSGLGRPASLFLLVAATGFVLSLGPRWGASDHGMALPFAFLEQAVPGRLTRVPARFASLTILGGAGLVAVALAALRPTAARAAAVTLAALVVLESFPGATATVAVPSPTAAHRELAHGRHAVLALPTMELDAQGGILFPTVPREAIHMYLSTANFQPLVNGYGAFVPAPYEQIVRGVQDFPTDNAFVLLRAHGVDRVVIESSMLPGTRWADAPERLAAWPGARLISSHGGTLVYDVSRAGQSS
ncbi:MAG: glycosyltransferase family 39 protein [Actinobacteria bacterium]|nr:glycosyltransferase family 39 protein [Actinomycetota bacterium]